VRETEKLGVADVLRLRPPAEMFPVTGAVAPLAAGARPASSAIAAVSHGHRPNR
jgi:hypothetical protein